MKESLVKISCANLDITHNTIMINATKLNLMNGRSPDSFMLLSKDKDYDVSKDKDYDAR